MGSFYGGDSYDEAWNNFAASDLTVVMAVSLILQQTALMVSKDGGEDTPRRLRVPSDGSDPVSKIFCYIGIGRSFTAAGEGRPVLCSLERPFDDYAGKPLPGRRVQQSNCGFRDANSVSLAAEFVASQLYLNATTRISVYNKSLHSIGVDRTRGATWVSGSPASVADFAAGYVAPTMAALAHGRNTTRVETTVALSVAALAEPGLPKAKALVARAHEGLSLYEGASYALFLVFMLRALVPGLISPHIYRPSIAGALSSLYKYRIKARIQNFFKAEEATFSLQQVTGRLALSTLQGYVSQLQALLDVEPGNDEWLANIMFRRGSGISLPDWADMCDYFAHFASSLPSALELPLGPGNDEMGALPSEDGSDSGTGFLGYLLSSVATLRETQARIAEERLGLSDKPTRLSPAVRQRRDAKRRRNAFASPSDATATTGEGDDEGAAADESEGGEREEEEGEGASGDTGEGGSLSEDD